MTRADAPDHPTLLAAVLNLGMSSASAAFALTASLAARPGYSGRYPVPGGGQIRLRFRQLVVEPFRLGPAVHDRTGGFGRVYLMISG